MSGSYFSGQTFGIVILGPPRTKKNHSRFIRPGLILPSKPYEDWEKLALPQIWLAWHGRPPIAAPVCLSARFYREKATGDLVGYLQALCDALEKAGVLANDKWVMSFDGSRLGKTPENPRIVADLILM